MSKRSSSKSKEELDFSAELEQEKEPSVVEPPVPQNPVDKEFRRVWVQPRNKFYLLESSGDYRLISVSDYNNSEPDRMSTLKWDQLPKPYDFGFKSWDDIFGSATPNQVLWGLGLVSPVADPELVRRVKRDLKDVALSADLEENLFKIISKES